jgi:hypothetical protein
MPTGPSEGCVGSHKGSNKNRSYTLRKNVKHGLHIRDESGHNREKLLARPLTSILLWSRCA